MKNVLKLHNDVDEVTMLAEWIEQMGEQLDLSPSAVFQLNLALEEAVVNVMTYAYPGKTGMPVNLSVEDEDGAIVFLLEDEGVAFDPTEIDNPDLTLSAEERPIGGLGIFLVNNIMNDVSYQRDGNRNILRMVYVPT